MPQGALQGANIESLLWLRLRRVYWVLEQPDSSVMCEHPRLARLILANKAMIIKLHMCCFGAECQKRKRIHVSQGSQ